MSELRCPFWTSDHLTSADGGTPRRLALRKLLKKEAFTDFCGVYEECRIDGDFCRNAMQIP